MSARRGGPPPTAERLPGEGEIVTVKVWETPVRLAHWVIVAAIAVLSVTGFYIGNPVVGAGTGPAFLMGKVRFVHYVTGWVLLCAVGARVFWMFRGNRWARWSEWVPWRRERQRGIVRVLRFYLFVDRDPPATIGHNPLAGLTYSLLFVLIGLQMVSGFAMYSLNKPHHLMWALTGWIFRVAPIPMVRLAHHLTMWALLAFLVHHVYSVWLADRTEATGMISSMVSGYKRVRVPEP